MAQSLTCGIVAWVTLMLSTADVLAAEAGKAAVRDGRVEAQLISEQTALVPGQTVRIGLRLHMDDGWHTYWKNPGDSGMATSISWDLPEGFTAHDIDWPAPEYYEVSGLASYAYEGEIVLPVLLEVPPALTGREVTLKASADWLVCKEQCEPGSASLEITLPVMQNASHASVETAHENLFTWASERQPQPIDPSHVTAVARGDIYVLSVREIDLKTEYGLGITARFFPDDPMTITMSDPQNVVYEEDGFHLTMSSNRLSGQPGRLIGVLVVDDGEQTKSFEIDAPLRNVAAGS